MDEQTEPCAVQVNGARVTQQIFESVDALVSENYLLVGGDARRMELTIDLALGHGRGSSEATAVLNASLPEGRFLIVAVEVPSAGAQSRKTLRPFGPTR